MVAIAYSHERSELRPSNRDSPRHALEQRVLERVLGVLHRAEHPVAVGVQLGAMGLHQPTEGILVAAAGGLQQLAFVHAVPHTD